MARGSDGASQLSRPSAGPGEALVRRVMYASPERMAVLSAVRALSLRDCWVAAGLVRAAVWDHLHGFAASTPLADIDVIYFDPGVASAEDDRAIETELHRLLPGRPWSVRNQARMHERNGDRPYRSSADAMVHWLETPTAVGIALSPAGEIEILAPFALDDLLEIVIRPTPHARAHRGEAFRRRVEAKPWLEQWPRARVITTAES